MVKESPMPFGWGGFDAQVFGMDYCEIPVSVSPMPFGWGALMPGTVERTPRVR